MTDTHGFSARLRELQGNRSVSAFARDIGVSQPLMVRYLAGGEPKIEKLVAMAEAADVSLLWLAAGIGPQGSFRGSAVEPMPALEDATLYKVVSWLQARWRYLGEKDREWLETAVERVPDYEEWQKKRAAKLKNQSSA